jgi:hypothetical protein
VVLVALLVITMVLLALILSFQQLHPLVVAMEEGQTKMVVLVVLVAEVVREVFVRVVLEILP